MSCHVRITGFHDVFVRVPIYYCNAVFSYPFYNNNLTDERPEANEQIGGVWGWRDSRRFVVGGTGAPLQNQ